jgi:hypothetical protein
MVRAFDFKIDENGARVVVAKLPMTPDCTDCIAIDAAIEALQNDLDAVGASMKSAIRFRKTDGAVIPFLPNPPPF